MLFVNCDCPLVSSLMSFIFKSYAKRFSSRAMTVHTMRSPDHENMPLRAVYSKEHNTLRKLFKVSQMHHFSVLIPVELLPTTESVEQRPTRPLGSRVVIDENCDIVEMLRLHLGQGDSPSESFFTSRFMECMAHPELIGIIVGVVRFPSMAVSLDCRLPHPRWVQAIVDVPKHYRKQMELELLKEKDESNDVRVVQRVPSGLVTHSEEVCRQQSAPHNEGDRLLSAEHSLGEVTGKHFTAVESPEISYSNFSPQFRNDRITLSSPRHVLDEGLTLVLPAASGEQGTISVPVDVVNALTINVSKEPAAIPPVVLHDHEPYPAELVTIDGCFTQSRYKRYLQPVLRLRSHHVDKVRPHLEKRLAEATAAEESEHYIKQAALAAARDTREKKGDTAPRRKSAANNAKKVQSNVMTRSAAKRSITTFISHNVDEDEEELEITKIILPASQSSDGSFLPRRVIRKVFVIN